jgi:hypothetical protein
MVYFSRTINEWARRDLEYQSKSTIKTERSKEQFEVGQSLRLLPAAWATKTRFSEQSGMSILIICLELSAVVQVQAVLCRSVRPVREADRTPASNTEDKNKWKWIPTSTYTRIHRIVVSKTSAKFYLSCEGVIFDKAFLTLRRLTTYIYIYVVPHR